MSPREVRGRMYKMDPINRLILERLKINCRTSLQDFSKISGSSANDVKKRIDSLEASGIIDSFTVLLSPLMTNEDSVIAFLEFETDQSEKKLIKHIGSNPSVSKVSRLLDGRYLVFGISFDSEELSALTMHLRKLPGISNVELYSR
ncbi:MAG: Lrp/AsnC family transcriptional regulator, partial [Candidatus Thorarchaeota archaeon]